MSDFARRAVVVLGVLLAAFGGAWLAYFITGLTLRPDSWRVGLLMAGFGLIPLVVGFVLVSRV
jgi:hypothetical protein